MVTYPNDWSELELNTLGSILTGLTYSPDNVKQSGKLVIRSSNIQSDRLVFNDNVYVERSCVKSEDIKKGDIIICVRNGSANLIGKSAYAENDLDATFGAFMSNFRCNNTDSSRFVYYYTKSNLFKNFVKQILGATINQITKSDLKKFAIFIPNEVQEQKNISTVISHFDEHIDNLTELIEKKKAIRDGALEDLISGRTRVEGFDGEWELVSFNQVITPKARIGWQGLKKSEYLRSGHSYLIGGTDFNNGTISFDSISHVCKERYEMDSNIQVAENDVLVTKDGTIGKVAIIPQIDKPATLNSGVFVFRTTKKLESSFLFRILSSSLFRGFIDTLSAGSTIKHLYQKDLKHFEFAIPKDVNEQKLISQILTYMDEEIQALETEKYKMVQIREGAMDDLLTGRVRLKI